MLRYHWFISTPFVGNVTVDVFWVMDTVRVQLVLSWYYIRLGEVTPTRYSKVRANTGEEGQPFLWGLWNIGISSRPPSLQLLLSKFSKNNGENFGRRLSLLFPLTEISCPLPNVIHLQSSSLYVIQTPVLSMWFLQDRCCLLLPL